MRHFPIFLDFRGQRIVVSGAGECAVAKLRLLLKSEAEISVFGRAAAPVVLRWAAAGRISYFSRVLAEGDADGAALVYGANEDAALDADAVRIGKSAGALTNIVDNLEDSQFITPAIVDRDPVTVAIGTEGAAPVLARRIKADLEERLPANLGLLARLGQAFRPRAEVLPMGARRRNFWSRFYFERGPEALKSGQAAAELALEDLLAQELAERPRAGHVWLVGTGPGDPELLTLKARRLLHEADVVIHDGVAQPILELARREAVVIEAGSQGALLHGKTAQVVRLVADRPSHTEIEFLKKSDIAFGFVPGVSPEPVPTSIRQMSEA